MAHDDDMRIEARLSAVVRNGLSSTLEQVHTLAARRAEHARLTRPPPQQPFAEVLDRRRTTAAKQAVQPRPQQQQQQEQQEQGDEEQQATPREASVVPSRRPAPTGTPAGPTQSAHLRRGGPGRKVIVRG